jgi:hypothetical protein
MSLEFALDGNTINSFASRSHVEEEEVLIGGRSCEEEIGGEKSKMDEKSHLLYYKRCPQPMVTITQQP